MSQSKKDAANAAAAKQAEREKRHAIEEQKAKEQMREQLSQEKSEEIFELIFQKTYELNDDNPITKEQFDKALDSFISANGDKARLRMSQTKLIDAKKIASVFQSAKKEGQDSSKSGSVVSITELKSALQAFFQQQYIELKIDSTTNKESGSQMMSSIYQEKDTRQVKVMNSPRISEGNLSEIFLSAEGDPSLESFDDSFVADRDEELLRAAQKFFETYLEEDYELYNRKPMSKDLIKQSGQEAKNEVKEAREDNLIGDEWNRYFGITTQELESYKGDKVDLIVSKFEKFYRRAKKHAGNVKKDDLIEAIQQEFKSYVEFTDEGIFMLDQRDPNKKYFKKESGFTYSVQQNDPMSRLGVEIYQIFQKFQQKDSKAIPGKTARHDVKYIVLDEVQAALDEIEMILHQTSTEVRWFEIENLIPKGYKSKLGGNKYTYQEFLNFIHQQVGPIPRDPNLSVFKAHKFEKKKQDKKSDLLKSNKLKQNEDFVLQYIQSASSNDQVQPHTTLQQAIQFMLQDKKFEHIKSFEQLKGLFEFFEKVSGGVRNQIVEFQNEIEVLNSKASLVDDIRGELNTKDAEIIFLKTFQDRYMEMDEKFNSLEEELNIAKKEAALVTDMRVNNDILQKENQSLAYQLEENKMVCSEQQVEINHFKKHAGRGISLGPKDRDDFERDDGEDILANSMSNTKDDTPPSTEIQISSPRKNTSQNENLDSPLKNSFELKLGYSTSMHTIMQTKLKTEIETLKREKQELESKLQDQSQKMGNLDNKVRQLTDQNILYESKQKNIQDRGEKVKDILEGRDEEIENMKFALEQYAQKNQEMQSKIDSANKKNEILDRQVKANRVEGVHAGLGNLSCMPMTGANFQKDNKTLNNSIMAFASKQDGNTSIMDMASGYRTKQTKKTTNNRKEKMNKSSQQLVLPNLNLEKVKSSPRTGVNKIAQSARKQQNTSFISYEDDLSGSSGSIHKMNSNDNSDSDDCEIVAADDESETSFSQRFPNYGRPNQNNVLEQVKQEQEDQVVRETQQEFKEGDSDYDSEDQIEEINDEQQNSDDDSEENDGDDDDSDYIKKVPNFDIVNVKDSSNEYHEHIQKLVTSFDKKSKLEEGDQLLFSDILYIYQEKVIETLLVVFNNVVYLLFKDSKNTMYTPFKVKDIAAMIMSPTLHTAAAFKLKDQRKLKRSHIIFQNYNMGLLVRYFQELQLYDLKVEFNEQFPMTIGDKPQTFNFEKITKSKQKEQNSGLVNSTIQGHLYSKAADWTKYWKMMFNEDNWVSKFYVLTNVGILVFEDDNFLVPKQLLPIAAMEIEPLNREVGGRTNIFKMKCNSDETLMSAPDRMAYESWMATLTKLIKEVAKMRAQNPANK